MMEEEEVKKKEVMKREVRKKKTMKRGVKRKKMMKRRWVFRKVAALSHVDHLVRGTCQRFVDGERCGADRGFWSSCVRVRVRVGFVDCCFGRDGHYEQSHGSEMGVLHVGHGSSQGNGRGSVTSM